MIPDKIFTYWEGDSLSYLHYMTILSLHRLNPDRKITIYTGFDGDGKKTWDTDQHLTKIIKKIPFSDILNISPNIILETIDFQKEYNIPNNISYIYKADITRIIKLYEHGGLWFDFDILFVKKIPDEIFNNTADIVYFSYDDTIATGIIASSYKNDKIITIYNVLMETIKVNLNLKEYEFYGPSLWKYCFSQGNFKNNTICKENSDIYPYIWNVIYLFFESNTDLVTDNTWGIHWYNGGVACKKFINSDNKLGDTTIEKYIKMIEDRKMTIKDFMCNIPVYIINLPDCVDRKNSVINEFKGYDNITFIEAIDGRNSDNFKKMYNVTYHKDTKLNEPCIAVILSHAKAIKKAYLDNLERVCIFEDDVHTDLIKNCNFTLNNVCNLNSDWDAIQLFYTLGYETEKIINNNHNNYKEHNIMLHPRGHYNYSGTCYIINRKGMEKILSKIIIVSDDMNTFYIRLYNIIDPETTILGNINTSIINRQLFYYYFETQTFFNYNKDTISDEKEKCQEIQLKIKNKLLSIYG